MFVIRLSLSSCSYFVSHVELDGLTSPSFLYHEAVSRAVKFDSYSVAMFISYLLATSFSDVSFSVDRI